MQWKRYEIRDFTLGVIKNRIGGKIFQINTVHLKNNDKDDEEP